MKTSEQMLADSQLKVIRSIAVMTTMSLLDLYVKGLHSADNQPERDRIAAEIGKYLDSMPDEMKDAVTIELMSAVTESVRELKENGNV